LAGGELGGGARRPRLDQIDELLPLLAREDHRRGELGVASDEADLGRELALAAVAGDADGLVDGRIECDGDDLAVHATSP